MHVNRRDAGFTLIELLIAVSLLGVVTLALGNAVIGYVRTNDATTDRLLLSHDAQLASAYFAADVAAMGLRDYAAAGSTIPFLPSIQTNAPYDAGAVICGPATMPTATVRFLSDDWDTTASPAARRTTVVAYYLVGTGPIRELHRVRCAAGAVTEATVAHYVVASTVTVTCSPECGTTPAPETVTLKFSVARPPADPHEIELSDLYEIELSGQRRQT